jgi:response regulator RpfG family c-di-GMP phosphodiesterase/serine/threonine protein kinase
VDKTGCWQAEGSTHKANGHSSRPQGRYPPLDHFLETLVESRLLDSPQLKGFLAERPGLRSQDTGVVVEALVAQGLLTCYQLQRLLAGEPFGLVIGNYRVLDWLGSGGMGVVYKAEHIHMKRLVALKVLAAEIEGNAVFLERFTSEMQALATLHHPNIVEAFDAGEVIVPNEPGKSLRYLVMKFVQGVDLERYVTDHGPLPIAVACDYIRQAANGLQHAHERGMVHRDVKPSNLLLTNIPPDLESSPGSPWPHGQLKILDFGLARLYGRRYTEAYTVLGTIDYMAPEQARDARSVDVRADIYGLGGTLYWLLTGQRPFPGDRSVVQELLARQHESPASVRSLRSEIPLELEAVVCQMMALDPNDRYPTPLTVVAALNRFLEPSHQSDSDVMTADMAGPKSPERAALPLSVDGIVDLHAGDHVRRVLILSPRTAYRSVVRDALEQHGISCAEAAGDGDLTKLLKLFPADVVLIDAHLNKESGFEVCRQLRARGMVAHQKLVLLTDDEPTAAGSEFDGVCDDQARGDASAALLLGRVRLALRLKEAEERSDRLVNGVLSTNSQLEQALQQRDSTASQAQDVLIYAMAKMAELRGQETNGHLMRMQKYVRVLAEASRRLPALGSCLDDAWVRMLERCVLLHDIGKVAIPDHILLKPGKLEPEERSIMESHTVLGADILEAVARQQGACLAFLQMAIDIVRYHHERYDGAGYPEGLTGDAIPLAARFTALADVYDAMRSKLVYKPSLAHAAVRRLLLQVDQTQFDPALMVAFRECETAFEQIFAGTPD